MVGPSLTLTCVTGSTCRLTSDFEDGDFDDSWVFVRDTCGVASAVHGFDSLAQLNVVSTNVTAFRVSAAGGLYRLCWCSDKDLDTCRDEMLVDIGSLQLLGPSPLKQDQTCMAGPSCALEIQFGHGQWSAGQLAILETCSVPTVVPHLSATGLVSTALSSSITQEEFHFRDPISAAGGLYSLCWCATPGPCVQASDFHIHVGTLTVLGPQVGHQTCISGRVCSLHGLLGTSLDSETLLIADTCGSDTGVVYRAEGYRHESATAASWSNVLAGGQYRLCWCGQSNCARAVDFMDIGGMLLIGPNPMEGGRTCISGFPCAFDGLTGHYLSSEDQIILSDTCGVDAFLSDGQITESPESFGASVTFGDTPLKISGGLYRLCWCSGNRDGSNHCVVGEDFKFDVGGLLLIGVAPLNQDKTCVSGSVCTMRITGTFLTTDDKFLILETCGVSAFSSGISGETSSVENSVTGTTLSTVTLSFGTQLLRERAQLCWCSGQKSCSNLETTFDESCLCLRSSY